MDLIDEEDRASIPTEEASLLGTDTVKDFTYILDARVYCA